MKGLITLSNVNFSPVDTDEKIRELSTIADEIWHEYFPDIIGFEQTDYMVEKFQSYKAMSEQIKNGYEYYFFVVNGEKAGYTGIHAENGSLFLSKLYVKKAFRGYHIASEAMRFLCELCISRGLDKIWLTVNRENTKTIDIYKHFGFKTVNTQDADIGCGYIMNDYIMELDPKTFK